MGMFDYIRCEVSLPDGWLPGELQTKDFDCEMVTHVITKDGRLMLERIDETHLVPKEERPYPNDDGLLGMCGSIRTVTSLRDSNFHGVANFYGSEGTPNTPDYHWHEYNAKFTDGNLQEIVLVETT
jgi:hypothetical protein